MAFLTPGAVSRVGVGRVHGAASLCTRRVRHLAPAPAQLPVRCSYATDLQTRTSSISATSTDALLERVGEFITTNRTPPDSMLQEMVLHLADSRGIARLNLVNSFGAIGRAASPYLLEGLRTCPNAVVRRSCGKALAQIGDAASVCDLVHAMLHDEDRVARASASGALARVGRPAVPALLQVLADDSGTTNMGAKGHAAWALAFMQADAADALLEAAHHPADDVRLAVVSALGAVLLGDSLPVLDGVSDTESEAISDDEEVVRRRCEKALTEALHDEAANVRAEAVSALANSGRRAHVGEVVRLLGDSEAEVRRASALALMKLGDISVLPALRLRVEDCDEDENVRSVARLALRALERLEEEDSDW